MSGMRILVDHSGYELLNIGDVSMLQVCVRRLRELWPTAEIAVITNDAELLAEYCPGTIPLDLWSGGPAVAQRVPARLRHIATQLFKIAGPFAAVRRRTDDGAWPPPHDLLAAIRGADVVVASGGGYMTDVWWWHGAGVLSVLRAAQRLGKPTAMFGQGVGPLEQRRMHWLLGAVGRRLDAFGLREGVLSPTLLAQVGVPPERATVTGDDALEIATPDVFTGAGSTIGLNIRVAGYTGTDGARADAVRQVVLDAARELGAPVIAVPVSRYRKASEHGGASQDLAATTAGSDIEQIEISTPQELAQTAQRCRVVVTSSYHAAVYGLAAGAAVVCLVGHDYYEAKFSGLCALFPTTATIVRLDREDALTELAAQVRRSWLVADDQREQAWQAARAQVARSRELYKAFQDKVEARRTTMARR